MALFEFLFTTAVSIISTTGYLGIFFLMVLESMVFPVPSEAVMPFAGYLVSAGKFNMLLVVIASTLGSIVGSLLSYYIGLRGDVFIEKRGRLFLLNKKDLENTKKFFKKHGEKTIFIARFIPVVRHLISIPAGFGRMDMKKFLLYTTAGAAAWNFILAYVGFLLGENWSLISQYTKYLDIAVIIVLVMLAIVFVKKHIVIES